MRKLRVKGVKCKPDLLMKNEIRSRVRELADRQGDSATFMSSEVLNSLRVPESETINSEADDIVLGDHATGEGFSMLDELQSGEDGGKTP